MSPGFFAIAVLATAPSQEVAVFVSIVELAPQLEGPTDVEIYQWAAKGVNFVVGARLRSRDAILKLEGEIRRCAMDVNCMAQRLVGEGVTHAVVVILNRTQAPTTLTTQLIDTKKREVVGSALQVFHADSAPISSVAQSQMTAVFGDAGYGIGGQITFEGTPEDAVLMIAPIRQGGEVLDRGPLRPLAGRSEAVDPGRYQIHLSGDGYEPAEVEVEVKFGEESKVTTQLEPSPGVWASPWLWTGVGVAVVGAGIAAYFLLRPSTYEASLGPPVQ